MGALNPGENWKRMIDRKRKIIMAVSAKAGHTMAVRMFAEHATGETWDDENLDPEYNRQREAFKNRDECTQEDIDNPKFRRIKIVRNPYCRAVSSYLHAVRGRALRVDFMPFPDMTFREFVDFLQTNLRNDAHWEPQANQGETLGQYRLVRLETIDHDIARLNVEWRTGFRVHHTARHHTRRLGAWRCCADVLFSRLIDPFPRGVWFYDEELRESIRALYADDFALYGDAFPCTCHQFINWAAIERLLYAHVGMEDSRRAWSRPQVIPQVCLADWLTRKESVNETSVET